MFLTTFIYLNVFRTTLYNYSFYDKQYNENGAYLKYGKQEVAEFTIGLFKYFKDDNFYYNHSFLSQQDIDHLIDVKNLIGKANFYYNTTLILVVLFFIALLLIDKKTFVKNAFIVLVSTGITIFIITLIMFLLRNDFSNYFLQFHAIFFRNNLWMMDPAKDTLINLFPQLFFYNFVKRLTLYGFFNGVVLFFSGFAIWFVYKKKLLVR